MAVHLVRFTHQDTEAWGVVRGHQVHTLDIDAPTSRDLIEGYRQALLDDAEALQIGESLELSSLTLHSPVNGPCRVLCQGANYTQHMIDSGMRPRDKRFNMIFNKSSASISGPTDPIVRPEHVRLLDYEVELGLVMGQPVHETLGRTANLADLIAGVVLANDVTARDVQIPQMQFFKGKSYRSFCPVGPILCLLHPDEIGQLEQMNLTLWVNGEQRQSDSTANLVFKPLETLLELSQISDLDPGDLVLTGTPSGCAMQIPSPIVVRLSGLLPDPTRFSLFKRMQARRSAYLKPGDVVEATIASADGRVQLGRQRNVVVAS